MNTPHRPLSAETLDELLSADLDGELDRAAADLGLTPAEARAALDVPEAVRRRASMIQARDRLATPDALTSADERRIVGAALARATAPASLQHHRATKNQSEGRWRVLVAVGSAAAVVVAIVALGAGLNGTSGDSKSSSADSSGLSESAATSPLAPPANAGQPRSIEFGDVSSAPLLQAKVRRAMAVTSTKPSTSYSRGDVPKPTAVDSGASGNEGAKGAPSTLVPLPSPLPQATPGAQGVTGPDGLQGDAGIGGFVGVTGSQGLVGQDGVAAPTKSADQLEPNRSAVGKGMFAISPLTAQICIASAARAAEVRSAPAVTGSGTYKGKPVVVVAFRQGSGYVAYVLSTPSCSVVARQSVA